MLMVGRGVEVLFISFSFFKWHWHWQWQWLLFGPLVVYHNNIICGSIIYILYTQYT